MPNAHVSGSRFVARRLPLRDVDKISRVTSQHLFFSANFLLHSATCREGTNIGMTGDDILRGTSEPETYGVAGDDIID